MRTIIIENDLTSIKKLENTLENIGITNIVGKYTSGIDAESELLRTLPDLIILEIDLIHLDGIELAKRIEREKQNVKFLFVASNSKYAIDAFELKQVDFLLKPFDKERIEKSLNKLGSNPLKPDPEAIQLISCFKNLHSIELDENNDIKHIEMKWQTKYAKEMFTYFITHKNINIRKDVLIELFWPELNLKAAYNNLYTNIHFIRKTIKELNLPIVINNNDDYYYMNLNEVKLDADFWLEKTKEYKSSCFTKLEKIMDLYQGHFLQEEGYLWAEFKKEEYRLVWLETVEYIIQEHVKRKNVYKAIMYALYYQKLEPFLEKPYYILMDLFAQIKDRGSIERQYEKLEMMLKEEFNTKPENKIEYFLKD